MSAEHALEQTSEKLDCNAELNEWNGCIGLPIEQCCTDYRKDSSTSSPCL